MSGIEEHAEELISGKPFPMSPELFFEKHVRGESLKLDDPNVILVTDAIDALRDYRTHLEDVWGQRVKMHADDQASLQERYRKAIHDQNGHDPE